MISDMRRQEDWTKDATIVRTIASLNSGVINRHKFFLWAIFLLLKTGYDSVNLADSGDIKNLIHFPGNRILKIWFNFEIAWAAPICVGVVISK